MSAKGRATITRRAVEWGEETHDCTTKLQRAEDVDGYATKRFVADFFQMPYLWSTAVPEKHEINYMPELTPK